VVIGRRPVFRERPGKGIVKLASDVRAEKLRGGFYTEPHVVDFCLERVRHLRGSLSGRWLEPSAGDGAFLRGLGRALDGANRRTISVLAVELVTAEASKCASTLREVGISGHVIPGSFFQWAVNDDRKYDVIAGNPPFVRYQFVPREERALAETMVARMGITLRGVSNLWIAFALIALQRLYPGGCFALVLPSEFLSTVSGGDFRSFLIRAFQDLSIDLFPRGTFVDLLQDVVVVAGIRAVRAADTRVVRFSEHHCDSATSWRHRVDASQPSWLRYLLTEREQEAYVAARSLPEFHRLGDLARLEVAIVTGANPFFTVSDATVAKYGLEDWTLPLLARTADSPGVVFTRADYAEARKRGSRTWLLDFSPHRPEPNRRSKVTEYLALGTAQGLPARFKCRIRDPWYRVPHIRYGRLMMTKRAHHYHRLLLNRAKVYTTDTIYRGDMHPLFARRETDLVAAFQNTLTLLSSEVEGRTYGGGVLELVPSELARLAVPLVDTGDLLERVDVLSRRVNGQRDASHAVMQATDEFLAARSPDFAELLPLFDFARRRLQARRQDQRQD
jgi:adenine-specific DNA methylase